MFTWTIIETTYNDVAKFSYNSESYLEISNDIKNKDEIYIGNILRVRDAETNKITSLTFIPAFTTKHIYNKYL